MEFKSKIVSVEKCQDAQNHLQIIQLEKPVGFAFVPGQFVMIACDDYKLWGNPNQLKWASFSIASAPYEPHIELYIRVHDTPGITRHIGLNKKVGDTINVKGPWGKFALDSSAPELAFVALGTGIAPLISMIRQLLHFNDKRPLHLFYGFRNKTCYLYEKELTELAKTHANFKLHTIASDDNSQGKQGYVQTLIENAKFTHITSKIHTYLCGPPAAIDTVIEFMKNQGFKEENLFKEKWE